MKNGRLSLVFILSITLVVGLTSCHDLKKKVDLIIYNAQIYAPDRMQTGNNCIAVKNGTILAIGTDAEIRSRYWASDNINGKQNFVYPGFIDAHSHFTGFTLGLKYVDLSQAGSFQEVIEILQGYHKLHPDGWIAGRGWDQNKWPEKIFPDNRILNKIFPGVPIVLTRVDGHAVLATEAAIKAAGIELPVAFGQAILLNGEFTGIFLEDLADKLRNAIPRPTNAELTDLMVTASQLCYQAGLTSVTDAGLTKSEILMLDSLQKAGKISLRIDAWMSPTQENFDYFLKDTIYETPYLRVGAIKMYADGALGSRGACLLKPYLDDPVNRGIMVTSPEQLYAVCNLAYKHGIQVNTHAIGDSAVRMVLHTYSKFLKTENDRRWRIEHAQVVNEDDFGLFGKYRIIPSVQATHATSDMDWAGKRLGYARLKNAYAYKKLQQQIGWIPNGTDFPIENIEPIRTFYAAVVRKNIYGEPEEGFMIDNALSRMEALKSITIWAAKASFTEKRRGSIEVGKSADFTILDTDILKAPENKILKTKVLFTIIGGKTVYKAN